MTPDAARERLAAWGREQPARLPLAEATRLLGAEEYPDLAPDSCLAYLQDMAERVRGRLPGADAPPAEGMDVLTNLLFVEEHFRGNTQDYSDPRNSYLNEVLERRTGLPITL